MRGFYGVQGKGANIDTMGLSCWAKEGVSERFRTNRMMYSRNVVLQV